MRYVLGFLVSAAKPDPNEIASSACGRLAMTAFLLKILGAQPCRTNLSTLRSVVNPA
jgi:hypothetical protein